MDNFGITGLAIATGIACFIGGVYENKNRIHRSGFRIEVELVLFGGFILLEGFVIATVATVGLSKILLFMGIDGWMTYPFKQFVLWYITAGLLMSACLAHWNRTEK